MNPDPRALLYLLSGLVVQIWELQAEVESLKAEIESSKTPKRKGG